MAAENVTVSEKAETRNNDNNEKDYEPGEIIDGWYSVDGKTYYFEDGILQSGFQVIGDKTYYFNEEKKDELNHQLADQGYKSLLHSVDPETGWIYSALGIGYRDHGVMLTGQQEIDGVLYAFDEQGVMHVDKEVDGYIYDEEGKGRLARDPREAIAEAALAQLGVSQDCTMLVTNSLKAVGINFHGAPWKYTWLGSFTNDPQPGDIIVYEGHVAIYIGDGMAVHGGWMGGTTAVWTVECGQPFVGFIRVDLPEDVETKA